MLSAQQVAQIHTYLPVLHSRLSRFIPHLLSASIPAGQILDEVLGRCVEPSQCQECMHAGERISHGKQFILNRDDPHLCQIWYVLYGISLLKKGNGGGSHDTDIHLGHSSSKMWIIKMFVTMKNVLL